MAGLNECLGNSIASHEDELWRVNQEVTSIAQSPRYSL
jgi:hypothetical protein